MPLVLIWRIAVIIFLLILAISYLRGAKNNPTSKTWQSVTFISGLSLIAFIIASPFTDFSNRYFFIRVLQHILLTGLTPFLIIMSNPYNTFRHALKPSHRPKIYNALTSRPWLKPLAKRITSPGLVWMTFVTLFWLWYDPQILAITQNNPIAHTFEMLSLLTVASLYWWHISAAAPQLHTPMPQGLRMFYAFAGMLPIKILGLIILFGNETLVGGSVIHDTSTTQMVNVGNVTFADKSLGAMIIWIVGGITYITSALVLAGRWMGKEEARPHMPFSILEDETTWRPPGLENFGQ